MPKVFLFAIPKMNGKSTGYAIAEDGRFVLKTRGKSPGIEGALGYGPHARMDVVEAFEKKFPEGYELEFVPDIRERPDVIAAIQKDPILKEKMVVQDWMNIPFPNQKPGFTGYGKHVYRNLRKE